MKNYRSFTNLRNVRLQLHKCREQSFRVSKLGSKYSDFSLISFAKFQITLMLAIDINNQITQLRYLGLTHNSQHLVFFQLWSLKRKEVE